MSEIQDITAPFPGILYRRADPGSAPFAEVDHMISAGDVIALVEVMKMFHEVQSPVSGRLVEFCVDDGDAVAMGKAIARVELS